MREASPEQGPVALADLPGWPGNRHTYRSYDQDRVAFLRRSQAEFGDTFRFGADALFTGDPELIRTVLSRSNREFVAEEEVLDRVVSDDALSHRIARWMSGRKLAGQAMRHPDIRTLSAGLELELSAALAPTQSGDTLARMTRFASRAATRYCIGSDTDEYHASADETTRRVVKLMSMSRLLPGWLPAGPGRAWQRAEHRSTAAMHEIIRRRRASPRDEDALIDALLALGLDDLEISATLRPTIGAAFGVPGTALTWALIHLLDQPDWSARFATEFVALGRSGSRDIAEAMPWTGDYLREVLRLYAPTWLMARQVRERTVLGSVELNAGARVLFSPLLVHTDPRWWRDPLDFDPQRWREAAPNSRVYLPFGAGPRVCVGAMLGTAQMIWALGHLCANYQLRVVELNRTPQAQALYQPTRCSIDFVPRRIVARAVA